MLIAPHLNEPLSNKPGLDHLILAGRECINRSMNIITHPKLQKLRDNRAESSALLSQKSSILSNKEEGLLFSFSVLGADYRAVVTTAGTNETLLAK